MRTALRSSALALTLLGSLAGCAGGSAAHKGSETPATGDRPLSFTLPDANGADVSFEGFRGKPAIIDFWASWCEPCKTAMPFFDELQAKHGADLVVIGVSVDEKVEAMKIALTERPVRFLILNDAKGKLAAELDVSTMPSTYLVDRKGVVRVVHRGFVPSDRAAMEAEVAKLIAEPALP